jgi:hypothetical protein
MSNAPPDPGEQEYGSWIKQLKPRDSQARKPLDIEQLIINSELIFYFKNKDMFGAKDELGAGVKAYGLRSILSAMPDDSDYKIYCAAYDYLNCMVGLKSSLVKDDGYHRVSRLTLVRAVAEANGQPDRPASDVQREFHKELAERIGAFEEAIVMATQKGLVSSR